MIVKVALLGKVMHSQIDQIKRDRKTVAVKKSVEVASFSVVNS